VDDSHSRKKVWTERSSHRVAAHLHAVLFDVRTSQKVRDGEWPSRYWHANSTTVGLESFLICARDEIQLVSRDFVTLRGQVLPASRTCSEMVLSPSRRLFSTGAGVDNNSIDAESFQPLVKWSAKEAALVHFTDTPFAGT
jgi:hypothetical protein